MTAEYQRVRDEQRQKRIEMYNLRKSGKTYREIADICGSNKNNIAMKIKSVEYALKVCKKNPCDSCDEISDEKCRLKCSRYKKYNRYYNQYKDFIEQEKNNGLPLQSV